jgi:hypothetical protein
MADSADPAAPRVGEISVEHLIGFFESAVVKLTDAGVPPENLVDALRVALDCAENLLAPPDKLTAVLERLRAVTEASPESEYAGPERRGPGRPWQRAGT